MSYWTEVDLQIEGEFGPPPLAEILKYAEPYIREQNWSVEQILEDLRKGIEEGTTSFNKLYCEDLEGLLVHLSQRMPDVDILMRGRGEEFRDLWIRELRSGEIVFSRGPFDDDVSDDDESDDDDWLDEELGNPSEGPDQRSGV